MLFIVGQVIGFIALVIGLSSFFQHNMVKFKLLAGISSIMWSISYYLLNGITSSIILLTIAARQIVSINTPKWNQSQIKLVCGFFISITVIFTIITWHGYLSLLPLIASLIATIAYFYSDPITLRKRLLITDVFWLVNSIALQSYSHLIASILSIIINLITIKKITNHEKNILPEAEM